ATTRDRTCGADSASTAPRSGSAGWPEVLDQHVAALGGIPLAHVETSTSRNLQTAGAAPESCEPLPARHRERLLRWRAKVPAQDVPGGRLELAGHRFQWPRVPGRQPLGTEKSIERRQPQHTPAE